MPVTKWEGRRIAEAMTVASMMAIDDTTKQAASEAQQDHWWNQRSGNLERQTINEPARAVRLGAVEGRFGTTRRRGFYGLFLEYREPFLRPVADRVFPLLHARLAERVREIL